MAELATHAGWVLSVAFVLSFAYELYRASVKHGVSRHDSRRSFLQSVPLYVGAAAVAGALIVGFSWAPVVGLVSSIGMILISIFYYNPRIMLERSPGLIDWMEDLVFTGLLFVAAALLLYQVLGVTLLP
jgi:hypothetical protein